MFFTGRKLDDARVVAGVLGGRQEDFGILVDRYLATAQAAALAHLGRQAEAEDAAQEAFIRAFQKLNTLREPSKFGAWFLTIVRNEAERLRTKRSREVPLEEEHAARLTAKGQPEANEMLDLLRHLVEAMDSGSREILLLHYYAGKSLQEIGSLHGISRLAAAKRLQRARDALSKEFLGRLEGAKPAAEALSNRKQQVTSAVLAASAPWLGLKAGAATMSTPGVSGGTGIGLLGAGTGLKLLLFGLLVAALGLVGWRQGLFAPAPESKPVQVAQAPTTPDSAAEEGDTSVPQAMSEIPAQMPSKETPKGGLKSGPGTVAGRLLDLQSKPVPGVKVELQVVDWRETDFPPERVAASEAVTDAKGWVEFSGLAYGGYILVARTENSLEIGRTAIGESHSRNENDGVLKPAAPIGGTVLDPQERPVAGAVVYPYTWSYWDEDVLPYEHAVAIREITNAEGKFQFPLLWPGAWTFYVVTADGPAVISDPVESGKTNLVVHYPRGATVKGAVVKRPTGEGLAGVQLALANQELKRFRKQAVSDSQGQFAITGLSPGWYQVELADSTMVAAEEVLELTVGEGEETTVEVPVQAGGIITGRAYDTATGEGIPGVKVRIGDKEVVTDALGEYIVMGLPAQPLPVRAVSRENYIAAKRSEQTVIASPGDEVKLDIAFIRGVPIEGIVVDDQGNPVPGARVTAAGGGWYATAQTLANGRFLFSNALPTSALTLRAEREDRLSHVLQGVAVGQDGLRDLVVTLDLRADARISGRLKSAPEGQIVNQNNALSIGAHPLDTTIPAPRSGPVNAAGIYNIEGVVPGEYDLFIEGAGTCFSQKIKIGPGEQLENVDIACVDASQRTLEGVVANRASVPVSGAFISVPGLAGVSARANTEGFFHLSGLPDRVFTLQVEHEDYCTASLEVDGQNERANVTLNRHASVAGRVVNATTRQAVKSFSITPGAPAFFNADDGRFELNGLCPETASLQVSAKGFVKQSVEVTLIAEENLRDLEIALEPGVRVDGVVTTASGTGIPGATIFVDNFPSQPSFATGVITQADGSFTLTDLPPSPAPIFAWKEGFALARAFSPAGGGALRLVLLPGGTLAGKVTVNGEPRQVFQVRVEILDEGVTLITGDVHDDSTYDVNGLPPGEVLAHIWSAEMVETAGAYRLTSRGRTTVRTVNIAAGETTTLDVNFPPATSVVEGTVATADDVAGQFMATLRVDTVEGQEQFSVQGDTEQGFSFAGVPAGDAALTVTLLPAMEEQREIAFTLQEGEVRQVQVDLVPAELTPE